MCSRGAGWKASALNNHDSTVLPLGGLTTSSSLSAWIPARIPTLYLYLLPSLFYSQGNWGSLKTLPKDREGIWTQVYTILGLCHFYSTKGAWWLSNLCSPSHCQHLAQFLAHSRWSTIFGTWVNTNAHHLMLGHIVGAWHIVGDQQTSTGWTHEWLCEWPHVPCGRCGLALAVASAFLPATPQQTWVLRDTWLTMPQDGCVPSGLISPPTGPAWPSIMQSIKRLVNFHTRKPTMASA